MARYGMGWHGMIWYGTVRYERNVRLCVVCYVCMPLPAHLWLDWRSAPVSAKESLLLLLLLLLFILFTDPGGPHQCLRKIYIYIYIEREIYIYMFYLIIIIIICCYYCYCYYYILMTPEPRSARQLAQRFQDSVFIYIYICIMPGRPPEDTHGFFDMFRIF